MRQGDSKYMILAGYTTFLRTYTRYLLRQQESDITEVGLLEGAQAFTRDLHDFVSGYEHR